MDKKSLEFNVIILAAGKGTRMKTTIPKVLHPVAGFPMIYKIVQVVKEAGASEVRVVVGYASHLVKQVVDPLGAICFKQAKQNGTASAVLASSPDTLEGTTLILNGDHPLMSAADIIKIVSEHVKKNSDFSVVSCELDNPGSFGRIVKHHDQLRAIVEAKDASHETLKIKEVNTGIYITDAELLSEYLPMIKCENQQGEYYLTDIISICQENGLKVNTIEGHEKIAFGVNNQRELAMATKETFLKKANELMDNGVIIIDPNNTYIEDDVTVGDGTTIYPGVYLKESTEIGKLCVIEPNAYIVNSKIGNSCVIKAGSYLTKCSVGDKSAIGPYAHVRPDSEIGEETKIGNFVELKKVKFGNKSKAGHLTYLGDAIVGEDVNIGCGTITCNYAVDKKKYITKIGDGSFIGSDSQFIAPVEVGKNAVVASGSTITKDVPDRALAVARGKQYNKENYNKS